MKKHFLLFIFLCSTCVSGYTQTAIDKYVSIEFPDEPLRIDTIMNGVKTRSFVLNDSSQVFSLQRLEILNETYTIPKNDAELLETYQGIIDGQITKMNSSGLNFIDSTRFSFGNLLCYKVSFQNNETGLKCAEIHLISIEKYIYMAGYFSLYNYNQENKDKFLKTLSIDFTKSPVQIDRSTSAYDLGYQIGYIMGIVMFLGVILLVIILVVKRSKKSRPNI